MPPTLEKPKTLSERIGSFSETVLPGVVERGSALIRSIQEQDIDPLKESFKNQFRNYSKSVESPEGINALTVGFAGIAPAKVAGKVINEAIRSSFRSPTFRTHFNFFKSISAPRKFRPPSKVTPQEAQAKGIAIRTTKGAGRPVPAVRKSGPFVPEDFPIYKNFKEVNIGAGGGTKDITRLIQEMDGALPLAEKVKIPGQAGPTERYVLWRTRDITKQSIGWQLEMAERLQVIKGSIKKGSKKSQTANKVLEEISTADKTKNVSLLLRNPKIASITNDPEIINFAKEARIMFDDLLDMQNAMRGERRQRIIPKKNKYSPVEFQDRSLWETAFGLKKEPADVIRRADLPDYIFPDKPFNPRELARTDARLTPFKREMDLATLMERYIGTAQRDIFATSIVQNNKAFIQQFETLGLNNNARVLEDWTAEAYAGLKAGLDRKLHLAPWIERGMNWFRRRLVNSVFPLNFAWNTFVQTSSATLTGTRYGWINTGKSSIEWFVNKGVRDDIFANAYSAIVKAQKTGKISAQDINTGVTKAVNIEKKTLERAADAANFFTEWVERHLTGISVRAAFNEGKKRGLKDKALWEYASDGGAKTQSMYNMEDLPAILRSSTVKSFAPFQTFSFEMFNTMREFAGKTGVPPGTFQNRMKWMMRFFAGAYTFNMIGSLSTGREPWKASSFIPFWGTFIAPGITAARKGKAATQFTTTRGLPAPVGISVEVGDAMHDFIANGRKTKLRRVMLRYGLPFGGTQVSRVVDGLDAIAEGGARDSSGRMMFPVVESKEKFRAVFAGPFSTKAGQEFLEERNLK